MNYPWVTFENGNYTVKLNLLNGTKIRETEDDFLNPTTIESMDIKITNCCDMGCKFCHENSTPDGKHANLFAPSFLDNLHPYTELAIGGGNPFSHPHLLQFLINCKERKHIPNMTVNQYHFKQNFNFIKQLIDCKLIYGLGISVSYFPDHEFCEMVKEIPNAVLHIIAGLDNSTDRYLRFFRDEGIKKLLILGYKQVRRGEKYYEGMASGIETNICLLKKNLPNILEEGWFDVVSFDNLALQQLNVKSMVDEDIYNEIFMGDDGLTGEMNSASMYADLVERKYAKNSCSMERFDLKDTVEEMYMHLRNKGVDEDLHAEQSK